MSTVSIAMCTYNGAGYLLQQLESLARQTRRPEEIIICDDASNDGSVVVAQTFAQKSGLNVRIHQNPSNLGYVKNFEKAIGLCTQDLIFLCDQDDLWHPQKIQKIVDVFDEEPHVGLVLHDFSWINEDNQPYPGPVDTYGPMQLSPIAGRNQEQLYPRLYGAVSPRVVWLHDGLPPLFQRHCVAHLSRQGP